MALISSVNYATRRIFLSVDSVGLPEIDPINIYKEYRGRRQLNTDGGQNFDPLISAFGNSSVGGSERTAEYTNLATGVKLVPFDADQNITITGFLVSTGDELQGRDLFDRSGILSDVDIDYFPPATKIVLVPTGGALTSQQATQLSELYQTLASAGIFSTGALANAPDSGAPILAAIAQLQLITAELHTFRGLNAAKPIERDKTGNTTTETDGTVTLTHTANPSAETVSTQRSG